MACIVCNGKEGAFSVRTVSTVFKLKRYKTYAGCGSSRFKATAANSEHQTAIAEQDRWTDAVEQYRAEKQLIGRVAERFVGIRRVSKAIIVAIVVIKPLYIG